MPTLRFTQNIQHPVACVLDDQGKLRQHMTAFINGNQMRDRDHLSDQVPPDAVVDLVQALSGG